MVNIDVPAAVGAPLLDTQPLESEQSKQRQEDSVFAWKIMTFTIP